MLSTQKQHGYTLVEIGMVLVIIGLLIGSTLKGSELIKATKDKKTITQWQDTKAAVSQFKNKFGAMPGDYGKATTLIDPTAVNGNNNSIIHVYEMSSATESEMTNTWEHLSLAGMINIPSKDTFPGRMPAKISGAEFWMATDTNSQGDRNSGISIDRKHYIHLLASNGSQKLRKLSETSFRNAISYLRADEFDRKYDDSNRQTGEIKYECSGGYVNNGNKKACRMQFYVGG
ncbi:MAG: type II secretion system protein [Alphaproteobacteria bacterium]|nr:type II secretion system protein [Alphaproteobacteria bacterium]